MSEPGNNPTNTNAGQTRGGRQSNPSYRGRGVGPVQRGNETTVGRSGGRGGGRSGPQFDRPGSGQQGPRRHPEPVHQALPFVNTGRVQNQHFHGVNSNVGAGPPGMAGHNLMQFGTMTPDLVPSASQYLPAQAGPAPPVQPYLGQGRSHPGQQPKLQQQPQHVIKASQGPVQVPIGLGGMPGGAMQQAPQYPQRQAIMQGHQMQPGQQAYPMAYQNAGFFNPPGLPPGVHMGGHQYGQQMPHQNQHQAQPQPQMQQAHPPAQGQAQTQGAGQPHRTPQTPGTFNTQPPTFGKAQPRQKKKLSLVDPNTGKAIELGGSSQASANGAISLPSASEAMPTRSLSEASKTGASPKPLPSKTQALPKPSSTSATPVDVLGGSRPSPGELTPSTALSGEANESSADSLSVAGVEAGKPIKAANGTTANLEALPKQPQDIQNPEPRSPATGPVGAPVGPTETMQINAGPAPVPEKTTAAPPLEALNHSKGVDTGALPMPNAAAKAEDVPAVMEQPAAQLVEKGEPLKAEEVSDPQGTAPAPRSPAAEEPEQADAEPSTKAAAPAPPDEVAAEAASAEPVAAQPTPPEDSAAQPAPAKADATQPAPSQADVARPAHAATVAPEAAPAAAAATAEATRDLEMAPPAVPDSVADEKDDPAEPTAVSAPSSESQGKSFEEAGHEQKLKPTADNLDTLPTLPTDNGDAGDHVVKEKGTGLQAAAAAAAELEEAITDEKPSDSAEKTVEEPMSSVSTAPVHSAKAKRRAALSKANAEGPKGGLLDAFTGPQPTAAEPQPEVAKEAPKQPMVAAAKPAALSPEKAQSSEADDWETVAEGMTTPSAAKAAAFKATPADTSVTNKKAYSRDWLLTLQDAHKEEPHGLMGSGLLQREGGGGGPPGGRAGPAGAFDMRAGPRVGPHMGPAHGGPPGVGAGGPPAADTSRWDRGSMMPPPTGPPGMGGRGMTGPPPTGGGRGGPPRGGSGIDGAKWQRGLQPPPPPPGAGFGGPQHAYGRPAPSLHKTDNAYKLGALVSSDPEEEKRQKDFKSLLNKLTLDNYATIKDKIVAVGIASETTMNGLIDQVFDKALGEPSFSGIYARLCYDLNQVLPSFKVMDEDGKEEDVEFRRVLLNKCQSEFEEGGAAMRAVEAREKRQQEEDAAKAQGKAEEEEEEREDGEITDSEKQVKAEEKKQKAREDMEAAKAELKGRRRALGNIQFIGNLYQHRMLTERIMHSCITELLTETENPKAEEVECLCKLMSTIGHLLDSGTSKKGQERMDAYFSRMLKVKEAKSLESRHRFLIQDIIDLREKQGWQARRKVEGPKKIEDIHKEARMEQQRARMAPPPERRDRRDRLPDRPAMPMRPERSRLDDRVDGPIRAMNRAPSYEYLAKDNALRPGGGAAREPSMPSLRPGGPGALGAGAGVRGSGIRTPSPAREPAAASAAPVAGPAAPPAPPAPPAEEAKELSPDEIALRSKNLVEEYLTNNDPKELFLSLQELSAARTDMATVVEGFFNGTFASRGIDRDSLVEMLVAIARKQDQTYLTAEHLEAGLKLVLDSLDQTYHDVPFAPKLVGKAIGALVAQGVLDLKPMAEHVLKAESEEDLGHGQDEDTELIDSGEGLKVVTALLERLMADKGAGAAKGAWAATGMSLLDFVPKDERDVKGKLQEILDKGGLQSLYPVEGIQNFLPDALAEGKSAADIGDWIREHSGDAADAPEFAECLAVNLIPRMLGPSPVDPSKPIFKAESDLLKVLLTFLVNRSHQEVAMVWGAQKVYEDRKRPKGLLRRMLTDLHELRVVSGQALETWRYKTSDTEAIKDVSSWLVELKQSDEGTE